jgi:NAD(P)-dependent dehydrogenase (short-subunit alcohol dehydrogenase family)
MTPKYSNDSLTVLFSNFQRQRLTVRLKDKIAIVTGGGSGIGQATALLFAAEGAKIVVADIDADAGNATASKIQSNGGEAVFVLADIANETDTQHIADETMRRFQRIDILVNNAATFVLKGLEASVEDWHQSLNVNVIGTASCSKYVAEHMKRTGGSIVLVSSISGMVAQPSFMTYSATKAALIQMSKNMAMDLAPFNIRVNCVCPFAILTQASLLHMQQAGISMDEFVADVGGGTLLKRIADPKEAAYAILFMASDEASFITGANLVIDGGYTAQ